MSHIETSCVIRDAEPADTETVVEFNRLLALETEEKVLDPDPLRRGVRRALEHPGLCRYFLAGQDGRIIGQAMITYEWSDWRDGMFWWLQSVYVTADYRRQGVFSALYRHIASLARATPQVCGLRLYVEENNDRARATYGRLGMAEAGYLVYEADWSADGA